MNYNKERAAIIAFTNPYVRSGQKALVLQANGSKYPVAGLIANTSAKVGAEDGTTGAYLVKSRFPKATLKTYSSAQRGAKAVIKGDIELFIVDAPTAFWMAGIYQNKGLSVALPVLTEDFMVWGVNIQNGRLVDQVNSILAKWAQNGTTNAILQRWVRL
jgi:ABC-type amino acid transport substrate-binding protein